MRRFTSVITTFIIVAVAIGMVGCGGNATPSTTSTPPSGGGGTPAPVTANTAHYEASLINGTIAGSIKVGTITVDSGKVTYQFSGWNPHQIFAIDFCSFPVSRPSACINVNGGGTADASGAAQGSFPFPHSGTWTGWFRFSQFGSNPILSSGWAPSSNGGTEYNASFVLENLLDKLQGGTATVTNGTIHVQIAGATASATYEVWEGFAGEGEDQVGTLTTDASGNASGDFASQVPNGLVILRHPQFGDSLETGFVVK